MNRVCCALPALVCALACRDLFDLFTAGSRLYQLICVHPEHESPECDDFVASFSLTE